ncbi:MAG: DUF1350 family protein [Prochlorotrichaceae cyanobacterium]
MQWQEVSNNWVLIPGRQQGIIHFLGGAFIGSTPHLTYRRLLESLASQGFVIIATTFLNTFDHKDIADTVLRSFEIAVDRLQKRNLILKHLPIYGIGHSMGCKLQLLIGSLFNIKRSGNILIAFNNYPAKRSIPLLDQVIDQVIDRLSPALDLDLNVEFTPTPTETLELIKTYYPTENNLLIKFRKDDLDQTRDLSAVLNDRFGKSTITLRLPGNHLTPVGQDLQWSPGRSFSPLDAVAQWMRQEMYGDLQQLETEMIQWILEN